ncbi:MAG: hypothetical protein QF920_10955, partial [Verrucomicrobiota bacterium]|nr:hypothetical protein [Verrucomicrobiota bacterium]
MIPALFMSESNEPDIMYHGAEWFEKNKGKLLYGALAVIIAAALTISARAAFIRGKELLLVRQVFCLFILVCDFIFFIFIIFVISLALG